MMCAVSSKMLLVAAFLVIFFCALIVRFATGPKGPTLPPGPSRVPIIGSIPFVPREFRIKGRGLHTPKLFHYLARTYGPVCHIWLGPVPTIILSDAKLLREAFKSNSITSRPIMKPFHEFRYGSDDGSQRGLVLSSGKEWDEQRKFTIKQLKGLGFARKSMESVILFEVGQLGDLLMEQVNEPIDLGFKTNLSVVNALWMILVGERLSLDDQRLIKIVQSIENVLKAAQVASLLALLMPGVFKMISPRFERARVMFEECKSLMRSAIDSHMASSTRGDESDNDFIHVYLSEIGRHAGEPESSFCGENGLRSLEIVLVDLFIGGSETTSTSINWTILYLLHKPAVQDKLHAELDRVVGRSRDNPPNLSHKPELDYMNAVITESMRKSTVVSSGVPHFVDEDTWIANYFFPKGTNVMANLTFIHYDPELWENPEDFNPDRFLSSAGHFESSPNVMPFSVGKRFCLGKELAEQEFYLFLSGLLHRFRFENPPDQELPSISFCQDDLNTGFLRYPPSYNVILRARF